MVRTWRIAKWTAPNGTTYEYEYIDSWGKRYRSFDSGLTQHTSKSEALRLAIEAGNKLTVVPNIQTLGVQA